MPEYAIELDDIRAGYDDRLVFDGLSARFPASTVTAVTGANGAGKSTLLAVIAGVQPLRGGAVRRASTRIAFVPQRSAVTDRLPVTVADVVGMGRWAGGRFFGRSTATDRMIVAESIRALGLDGLERRSLSSLSGGQRQRAIVAQGLAQRADILLLDEPTVGLDEEAHELIGDAIAGAAARGACVIHATHDMRSITSADAAFVVSPAKVSS